MARPGHRRFVAAVAAILVALSIPAGAGALQQAPVPQQASIDPDRVLLAIDLAPSGSAVWRIEYRVLLDDENATEAFESVRADIEADPGSFTGPFAERMRTTVATAENVTGREMALRNVTVAAQTRQLPQRYGVVTYRFEWAGFAGVDGAQLHAGDAIDGLFLDEETRLLVSWPTGYRLLEATPSPDDQRGTSAAWVGPLDFADGQPRVVVTSGATTTASEPVDGQTAGPTQQGGNSPGDTTAGGDLPWTSLAVVFLALLGVVGWFLYDRRRRPSGGGSVPPEDLLSNEERVLRLLDERGGRMKQQEVAEALGWTDARTSQVVGQLRDTGDIESFRLGRENVLSLPSDDD